MKFRFSVIICGILLLMTSCGGKDKAQADASQQDLEADESVQKGIVQMQKSHVTDTVVWRHQTYKYDILREPDPSLPHVKDSETGSVYADNHIILTISKGGEQVFTKTFTKSSFDSYLDKGFRQNGILEGLVFDEAQPEGLRFATSVCYPQSDLYVPLVVMISSDGGMTISKDDIMDAEEEEAD